jgi:TamB, inner membrane protein subunit of TAM complex
MLWLLVQLPPVQNWLVTKVTDKLSGDLHTRISIKEVDFSLFNKMLLRGLVVHDQKQDTLLYAGTASLRITDWFFFKDKIELKYIGLDDAFVHIRRSDSIWNYQFLADYFGGSSPGKKKQIDVNFKTVELSRLHLLKEDRWRGEDMELRLEALSIDAEKLDLARKSIHIRSILFTEPDFAIRNYQGNRPYTPLDEPPPKNDPLHLRWNPANWNITVDHAVVRNGSFRDDKLSEKEVARHFDGYHILFAAINADFKNVVFIRDTITARISLSTTERSNFTVKKLTANMKFFPEAMEFSNLDLITPKSHLKNFFAMRFRSFDDFSYYTDRVRMEANFRDATVDSDDIGYFAPALQSWKKKISITGKIKGPVSDLQGKNILIAAGQQTTLNGDIHITGLPDVDRMFIDFKSNNFNSTYKDAITFLPFLKNIRQPRIDRVETLHFVGNFLGTIHDFATSGTIETNIGTLVTNLNMKFLPRKPAIYSGTLTTNNFDLGKFMDDSSLGKIFFQGKISGSGLATETLNATLDGEVSQFNYHGYTYQDIFINGMVAKKKFNGKIISNDSSLHATLNGLIDLSGEVPTFNFDATIDTINFKALHLVNENVAFAGKLHFNFTGSDIDHFMGTARIHDASFYKRGQRLSFDSLVLESKMIDSSKTITVASNEFEAALVGEFSIKELPAAFQEFLHRYYPSYIKPNTIRLSNENFSFVIITRKIDDYLDLFAKDLKGFNFANIQGRINSRQNLLNVVADVPQFSYKNISFYKVNLKGQGNFDSLSLESTMGEVYVNDSLHFPSTHIQLRSFNDLSSVRISTSANQTLNAANISANVQTLADGVRIKFNPSTFDINSKTWIIDKNGELTFSHNIIGADALKIHTGDQEINISTRPSGEGNWNDVYLDLRKINIADFAPFFVKSERLEGLLTGSASISDPFNHTYVQFVGQADQFRFSNDSIGRLALTANYDRRSGMVNSTVNSSNKDYHFDLKGVFDTNDSAAQPINITVPNVVDTKIDLIEKYIGNIFSGLHGRATGNFQVVGTPDNLNYLGDVQVKDASLHLNYTQCTYRIPSALFHFRADQIDFGSFELLDTLGNKAELSRGKLFHHSFRDLRYDFALNTNRLLMLNTRVTDNNQFYGTLIGKAAISISGPQENLQMYIKGEPTDSSNIYIPTTTSRESADADFIVWKVYGKEMKKQTVSSLDANFTVTLDVTANNYANVYVIIDPLTKDIIKANGHGNLHIQVGTTVNMNMRGKYEIDRGNYNFTFQSFIKKPFVFMEGADNYIQWTGDPYDADINIQAIYEAENVQFSDLGLTTTNSGILSQSSAEKLNRYHGPVWVVATLSDKLVKPAIAFEIELPPNSELRNNQDMQWLISHIESDPNELNKQVAFLIVFNSFGPLTNSNTAFNPNEAVGGIFINSISGFVASALSHQFSNIFQKVFKDKSIRVNFNPSFYNGTPIDEPNNATQTYDRTNLNLSVIKSFLNERLTFTVGSALDFGLTAQQTQYAAVQFLPNITAEWKITPSGRVVLSFFYRDSYNYLSVGNHTTNSSGTSISYRRDFDRIDEFFKGKKKEVKPAPATTSNP